jgi:hypothetical protein
VVTSFGHWAVSIIEPRADLDRARSDSHCILGLRDGRLQHLLEPVTRIIVPSPH